MIGQGIFLLGGVLIFAAVSLPGSPGAAQALCPPGTHTVPSSNPFQPRRCVRSGRTASGGAARVRTRSSRRRGRTCPEGSYSVATGNKNQPYICAPKQTEFSGRLGNECVDFNARFSRFHNSFARKFGNRARNQDRNRDHLRRIIKQQTALSRQLKFQAARERNLTVRRHLRRQVRVVDQNTRARRAELRALDAERKHSKNKWKEEYKKRARNLLRDRPPGCPVNAVGGGR